MNAYIPSSQPGPRRRQPGPLGADPRARPPPRRRDRPSRALGDCAHDHLWFVSMSAVGALGTVAPAQAWLCVEDQPGRLDRVDVRQLGDHLVRDGPAAVGIKAQDVGARVEQKRGTGSVGLGVRP
jgi:hypothetical protein